MRSWFTFGPVHKRAGLGACAPGVRTTRDVPPTATSSGLTYRMDRPPRIGIVHAVIQRVSSRKVSGTFF